MNTPNHDRDTATDPDTDAEGWWPRLADHINDWWIHRRPTGHALHQAFAIPPKRAAIAITATAATVVALTGLLIWWIVSGIVGAVTGIAAAISDSSTNAAKTGAHDLASWSLTRTITEPVRTFIDQQATGLPVAADTLWLTWLTTTGLLFLLAALGSRGARIGWTLTAAMTVAMVYTTTPASGRALAAGLTLTIWAVLSTIALNRAGTRGHGVHITIPIPRRPRPTHDDD